MCYIGSMKVYVVDVNRSTMTNKYPAGTLYCNDPVSIYLSFTVNIETVIVL